MDLKDAALGASGSAYSQAVTEATQKRDSLDNEAGRSVIQAKNAVTEAENATDIEVGQAKADEVSDADEVVDRITEPNPSESATTVTVDYENNTIYVEQN